MPQQLKDLLLQAAVELKSYQTGNKHIVKTGYPAIDHHMGGLLPGDMVAVAAPSGHGKTEFLLRLREKVLDTSVNPEADDFVWLDFAFEMKVFNLMLRQVSRKIGKKKSEVLFNEFTDEEKKIANDYITAMDDDRRYIEQEPNTIKEFANICSDFLEQHKSKRAVFISVDHMLLFNENDKKEAIDKAVQVCNKLKKTYDNVYFIFLTQLNRTLSSRIDDRSNAAAPRTSDIFGSSFIEHICSYILAIYDPFKAGIEEYMSVYPSMYEHVAEYLGEENKNGRASFDTPGNLFYHMLKVREYDDFRRLFVEEMDTKLDLVKVLDRKKPKEKEVKELFSLNKMPIFDSSEGMKPNRSKNIPF